MSVTGISRSSSPGDLKPVIAAISAGLAQQDRARDLTGIFERELERSLSIRSVRLREIPARYRARLVTPTGTPDSIVLGVPTGDPRVQAVLEACSGPERIFGSADHDTLAAAAQLGGLVLELARGRPARRGSDDGAAPLIGSSRAMQRLRERIERVAFTGFTALIQG